MTEQMFFDTDCISSLLFRELTRSPLNGRTVIGKGEASALVLAKEHGGIVASNNLKDVKLYIDDYGLSLKTTADILVKAFSDQFLNESDANIIWADMIKKRRKMPACSFSEYLRML